MIVHTPEPPYVAVIFTAIATDDVTGYEETLHRMRSKAEHQPGYLGIESAGGRPGELEVTVSYWSTEDDARAWKAVAEHVEAQRLGRERWYRSYRVRIAHVGLEYGPGDGGPERV